MFQYDDAFIPRKLSNWENPKLFDEVCTEYVYVCNYTESSEV